MVEKGTYTRAQALLLQERDAFGTMYEGGGLMTTDNAGMQYPACHHFNHEPNEASWFFHGSGL